MEPAKVQGQKLTIYAGPGVLRQIEAGTHNFFGRTIGAVEGAGWSVDLCEDTPASFALEAHLKGLALYHMNSPAHEKAPVCRRTYLGAFWRIEKTSQRWAWPIAQETFRPEEIPDEHIPTATDELDAVVSATEVATNAIMGAAEKIEAVAAEIGGAGAEALSNAVTEIYEACSFQDITGQRIGKVVTALKEIERKVETVVEKFGPDRETREKLKQIRQAEKAAIETGDGGQFEENDLLHGPQLPDNANTQDEIDALFADMR